MNFIVSLSGRSNILLHTRQGLGSDSIHAKVSLRFWLAKGRLRTDLANGNYTELNDSEDENGRIFIWLVGWLILLLKAKRERRKEKMRGDD